MTTEVAGNPSAGHTVLSARHYEAGPPVNASLDVVDPDSTYATTKEEEWITKKKTELTTTRQIETRVKRQVVLEDGKVVGDSGPIVTTNTTEDTETQEHKQTEHRKTDDDPPSPERVAMPGPAGMVKEVKERKVKSREQREERVETEDVQHLGDLTDEAYQTAVQNQLDVREALRSASPQLDETKRVVSSTPKVVHQSSKSHKVVDTEDTEELSQLQGDGRLVTETRRTREHEEVLDKEEPDETGGHSEEEETRRESSHRFAKSKDQDLVEYIADGVKIGEEMRYVAENLEGERHGDPADMADHQEWDSLSTRIRRMRRQGTKPHHTKGIPSTGDPLGAGPLPVDRKDALTKKPLDFDQEEETRKAETSKWLEHHFGSDSRSSKDSIDDDDLPTAQPGGSTSFINVTMTSRPINSNRAALTRVAAPVPSTSPNTYTATVNTSSRIFLSSPDTAPASGFFQGVNEWSERRNEVKETRTTFTPATPQRPDRIQVLPSGPNHTFNQKNRTELSSPHNSNNHLDRMSPHPITNHISDRSSPFQSSTHHSTNRTAAHDSSSFLSTERKASSHHKQNNGRRSPHQQKTSERTSPYEGYNDSSRPEVTGESPNGYSSIDRAPSPYLQKTSSRTEYVYNDMTTTVSHDDDDRAQSPQPPYRRRHIVSEDEEHTSQFERDSSYRRHEHNKGTEPSSDYSPPQVHANKASPSPSPSPSLDHPPGTRGTPPPNKKLYQRTRFAADIPPPPARQRAKSPGQSTTSIIGESFRKLVDKFRSSSSERKNKRRNKRQSRSPSPHHPHTSSTYQQYHVIDSNIPSVVGPGKSSRVGRRGGESPNEAAERGSGESQPVAPPRSARTSRGESDTRECSTQTGRQANNEQAVSMDYHRRGTSPVVQRFYLGEDPFGGSIYGREREYDGVTPVKSTRRHHRQNGHRRGSHPGGEEEDMNRTRVSSNTLGRLSKSTSRLASGGSYSPNGESSLNRNAQTLPRKLYDERIKNQTYIQRNNTSHDPHRWESSCLNRINKSHQPHSNSMINVSIINNVTPPTSSIGINKPLTNGVGISTSTGPAKPARTYRSNLARSKSFNVHAGGSGSTESSSLLLGSRGRDVSNVYKSNPHLHRLDESPPPLKSPGILASISRSQRDLTESSNLDKDDNVSGMNKESHTFSKSTSNLVSNGPSTQEAKKKLFLRGLMDRAPELYKTLHGDEDPDIKPLSPSPGGRLYKSTPFKNGNSNKVSSRRNLDYSNSFRSSGKNATPENDSMRAGRILSSSYRSPMTNGVDRVTSPKPSFTSTLNHTPSFRDTNNGTTTSIVRRGSIGSDDYSETVRITSKSDDPIRPSVTNTVQSYSKKTIPTKRGLSTETIESSETKTVTKSRLRVGDSTQNANPYSMLNGGGGVVIEVRAPRK